MSNQKSNIQTVNKLFSQLSEDELQTVSTEPWKSFMFLVDPDTNEWIALNPDGKPVGVNEVQLDGKTHLFVRSLGHDVDDGMVGAEALLLP